MIIAVTPCMPQFAKNLPFLAEPKKKAVTIAGFFMLQDGKNSMAEFGSNQSIQI